MLAKHFLHVACVANDRRDKTLSPGALSALGKYDFPGNVRELKNLVERLVILGQDDVIDERDVRAHLPIAGGGGTGYYRPGTALTAMMDEVERDLVLRALEHHAGHVTKHRRGPGARAEPPLQEDEVPRHPPRRGSRRGLILDPRS
jgi:two-component system nitrogen regulation response regulator NtrX